MRIVCTNSTAQNLDLAEAITVLSQDQKFPLILDKEYIVMGMSIPKDSNCLYYLIDENNKPAWYPYGLFTVSNNFLPEAWSLQLYDKKASWLEYFVVGFDELAKSHDYYKKLEAGDSEAVEIYFKRKAEIELYLAMYE